MLPVTLEDIEAANKIAPEVLGRSLDELPPQGRRLLDSIKELIREKTKELKTEQRLCLFSRRELREKTGWSEFQVRTHTERLEQMEYVNRRSGKQGSLCKYELLVDANEKAEAWQVGLLDIAELRKKENVK
ncbi:MAG: Cdc6-like AAA superfamily ATPase [Akkermansiaceae bacterium]|jgi:DNA primase